ncbi:MAG: hypothetical protein HYV97_01445 [Bdellovibrio sp.]|nr:hypothetical protein [Bdellovibrio sp.]
MKRMLIAGAFVAFISALAIMSMRDHDEKVIINPASTSASEFEKQIKTEIPSRQRQTNIQESNCHNEEGKKTEDSVVFFAKIENKVFLTSEEIAQKQKYLSSKDAIERNVQYLLQDRSQHYTRKDEQERFKRLKFFISAGEWKENPGKSYLRDALSNYVEKRSVKNELDIMQKKSIAADMITMVQILAKLELNTAQRLVKDRHEEREKRILNHGLKLLGI